MTACETCLLSDCRENTPGCRLWLMERNKRREKKRRDYWRKSIQASKEKRETI